MAAGNVAVVKEMIRAWNERDADTVRALTAPEVEYVNPPNAVEPGTRQGQEALAEVMRKQWEGLGPDARQEIELVHDRGDQVFTEVRLVRSMPGSDTEVDARGLIAWSFRDGKVARLAVLAAGSDLAAARAAAGLGS
jgi:ketosteroid isomerase-like protein